MSFKKLNQYDEYIIKEIKFFLNQKKDLLDILRIDRDDAFQEMYIYCITAKENYDPSIAKFSTLLKTALPRNFGKLLSAERALKKDKHHLYLEMLNKSDVSQPVISIEDRYSSNMYLYDLARHNQYDIQDDFDILLHQELSTEEKQLLRNLITTSLTDIAEKMGIPRTTVDYKKKKLFQKIKNLHGNSNNFCSLSSF